jgi:hypothetical protein
MRDNAKDFDEALYGIVVLFEFTDAEAQKHGFICAEKMAIGLELLIAEAEDTFSCAQEAGIQTKFAKKQAYEKVKKLPGIREGVYNRILKKLSLPKFAQG